MESGILIPNLVWLDEAFAKDYVDELEAACCLTEGQNRVYFGYKESSNFVEYDINPILRSNYRVICTWKLRGQSLLAFIDKAILINLQNFRRKFLLEKCKELFFNMSPADQSRFISDYYYISRELSLSVTKEDANPIEQELIDEVEYAWVPYAKNVYNELELHKSNLSMEQRATKVETEMKKRFVDGDKNMAKRGGKEVPSSSTILRHALQNL